MEKQKNYENFGNTLKNQAVYMANWAGIDLTLEQIDLYAELRTVVQPNSPCDQQLLHLILEPDQKVIFVEKYKHIDFEM